MAIKSTTNSDYLSGTVISGAVPLTVRCAFRFIGTPSTGNFQGVWSIDDNSTNFIQPYLQNPSGTVELRHGFAHGFGDPLILTSPVVNTWYDMVSIISPGSPGIVYLTTNGSAPIKVTDSTPTPNAGNIPSTTITITNESAHDENLNGSVAMFMAWDRLLTEQEARKQLTMRTPVSRNKLRYFLPLLEKGGPEISRAGYGPKFTQTGSLGWDAQMPPLPTQYGKNFGGSVFNTRAATTVINDAIFFGAGTTS